MYKYISFRNNSIYGKDIISGTLKYSENSKPRPFTAIYVMSQKTREVLIFTFSDMFGNFEIKNIDLKKGAFFIISHDPVKLFNGVIADNIGGENVDG